MGYLIASGYLPSRKRGGRKKRERGEESEQDRSQSFCNLISEVISDKIQLLLKGRTHKVMNTGSQGSLGP